MMSVWLKPLLSPTACKTTNWWGEIGAADIARKQAVLALAGTMQQVDR